LGLELAVLHEETKKAVELILEGFAILEESLSVIAEKVLLLLSEDWVGDLIAFDGFALFQGELDLTVQPPRLTFSMPLAKNGTYTG
jgi:hypothetical protein